jgi:hypothetical protein
LIETPPSDRRDNAKLGEMRSDRIDHRSLPTDEEMARAWFTSASSLPMPIGFGFGLSRIGFVEETTHFELVERATASKPSPRSLKWVKKATIPAGGPRVRLALGSRDR